MKVAFKPVAERLLGVIQRVRSPLDNHFFPFYTNIIILIRQKITLLEEVVPINQFFSVTLLFPLKPAPEKDLGRNFLNISILFKKSMKFHTLDRLELR